RSRMARDLHDVIAGHLSAIAIQSEAVLSMAVNAESRGGDPAVRETVNTVLRSVRENSVQALNEMRTMIGLLRGDDDSDPQTSPPRLRELDPLIESARAGGVRLEVIGDPAALPELPAAVDLVAYRIVQEALTNVVKHASGAAATLRVDQVDHRVEIEVRNELTSTPATTVSGTGLASMRERAQSVGGSVTADRDGNVWRVHARLPVGEIEGLGGEE
ncbi:MAG TPA: histidine kinase, partial [Actinopolymorphaceae bacterium]